VKFSVHEIYHETFPKPLTKVFLSATNFGPGAIKVTMIDFKGAALWRRVFRRVKYGVIIWDYTEPLSGKLPTKLEVGESIDLLFKYGTEFKLTSEITHIGLRDSFGRVHWASCRDVKTFKQKHAKDFSIATEPKQ